MGNHVHQWEKTSKVRTKATKSGKSRKNNDGFLILMQKVCTHNLLEASEKREIDKIRKLEEEIFSLNEIVKAEMQFYLKKEEYQIAREICGMANPQSIEEANRYNEIRGAEIDRLISIVNNRIMK